MTPVLFRKFKDGNVIALFPTILCNTNVSTCLSYMHIGQHGNASVNLIYETKLAKPDEYKSLLDELISIGYDDLKVYQRYQYLWTKIRENKLKETVLDWSIE